MKEIYYTYNNEAIACCVFLSALKQVQTIDVPRSCLLLPFLLDDRTVSYLQRVGNEHISMENLIKSQPRLFSSFNKRFTTLLPITINTLMILSKSNQIEVTKAISLKENNVQGDIDISDRFNEIRKALPILMRMIENYDTTQLYKLLRIQL